MAGGGLASLSAYEVTLLAFGLALVVGLLAHRVRAVCKWAPVALAYVKRCRLFRGGKKNEGGDEADAKDDAFAQRVAMEVEQQWEKHTMRALMICANGTLIIVTQMLLNVITRKPRWMTPAQDWCLLVWLGISALSTALPRLLRGRARDSLYSAHMLVLCVAIAGTRDLHEFSNAVVFAPRFLLSLAHGRTGLAAFWNTAYLVASQYSLRIILTDAGGSDGFRGPMQDLVYFATIVTSVFFATTSVWAQVRDRLQVTAFSSERLVMRRLLDLMCDATIDLNGDLEFSEHFSQFAGMLMLDPSRNVKGTSLLELIVEEDKEHLRDRMLAAEEAEDAQAGALHTNLRDSMDNRISAEVFYVPYRDLDGAQRFMAGVREVGEQDIADLKQFPKAALEKRKSKNAAGPAGHGTAPVSQVHSLSDGAEDNQSVVSSRSPRSSAGSASQPCRLMEPALLETKELALQISLAMTMKSWNLEVRQSTCCWYHAAAIELNRGAKILKKRPCSASFKPVAVSQCQSCGILSPTRCANKGCCSVCSEGAIQNVASETGPRVQL